MSTAANASSRPFFRFNIRWQLLLALTVLLALPWIGYEYLHEVDRFLRSGQERALRVTAKAVATALYERSDVLRHDDALTSLPQAHRDADQVQQARATQDSPADPAAPPVRLPTQPLVVSPPLSTTSIAAHQTPSSVATLATPEAAAGIAPSLEAALQPLVPNNVRLWVIDRNLNVIARLGSLHRLIDERPQSQGFSWRDPWPWLHEHLIEPIYARLLEQPTEDFVDDPSSRAFASAREVEGALAGIPMLGRRPTEDQAAVIAVAATPIWSGDRVTGAVIVEETTNGILATRNQAFERLFSLLLAAIVVTALVLISYASWLTSRIRKLRNDIERAVDAHGRLRKTVASARAGDEIGDLSRSFADMLARLEESSIYREQMASRLSHELRTPIAVVRSSLDNLREARSGNEQNTYLERAQGGLARLSHILARMTEASRLDQSILDAERASVDLCALLTGSVEGYTQAYTGRRFSLRLPDTPCRLYVAPDLIVQMLDKLVANAHEFAPDGTLIDIHLQQAHKGVVLRVANEGPLPPEGNTAQLFEPMVSMRPGKRSDTPHLGLGLYIVRLIAEFHGGNARIAARDDALGTVVTVTLNAAPAMPADNDGPAEPGIKSAVLPPTSPSP